MIDPKCRVFVNSLSCNLQDGFGANTGLFVRVYWSCYQGQYSYERFYKVGQNCNYCSASGQAIKHQYPYNTLVYLLHFSVHSENIMYLICSI